MTKDDTHSSFAATLLCPTLSNNEDIWAFVVLPKEVSEKLPRRGRTSVDGTINGHAFQVTLEPDGQLSHWLKLEQELLQTAGVNIGDTVSFELRAVEQEPEPQVPADLFEALVAMPEAKATWDDTTTIARLDWIHWVTSAKQVKTRVKRINDACDMLQSGKRRVCCFDPSGYYSKAFSAPKAVKSSD
ncbi:YdeI/OmpD-associated family protein [Paraglaciecola hydrolytica]|uniref:DUF1905 domain-containing protein n=1 Tax=Paraglaciecola hydrolytica TaxID=1799789 RepID=A0A148KM06_9ALTE|nr:YdeI/OmpD-associated family protein [Paraglaciecola hydrolytica]KXI27275.1 hypothetical protein AX660_21340 [Paraglaciecola hydrolytica]